MRGKMKKVLQKIAELTTTFMTFFKSSEMSLSSIAVAYYLLLAIFPLGSVSYTHLTLPTNSRV